MKTVWTIEYHVSVRLIKMLEIELLSEIDEQVFPVHLSVISA